MVALMGFQLDRMRDRPFDFIFCPIRLVRQAADNIRAGSSLFFAFSLGFDFHRLYCCMQFPRTRNINLTKYTGALLLKGGAK